MKPLTHLLCTVLGCASLLAQQPAPPPPANAPATSAPADKTAPVNPPVDSKGRPIPSFLITGTVFNEKALSFPGVQVRIRRTDEKKARWETYTNSRGEFAVRVVPGYEYEVVTHIKKYQDQKQTVDAKVDVQQRLSIKLQPAEQGKAGAKP
jgi:Carboxypeptidase regulatory-like domain